MKALRYLLIVMMLSVASLVFATAQSLAQQPRAEMHSTSGMVSSGSALPSAAVDGAVLTGTSIGTYTPADAGKTSGPNRARRGLDDGDDDIDPQGQPFPLGDAALPLALLALAYVSVRAFLNNKRKMTQK